MRTATRVAAVIVGVVAAAIALTFAVGATNHPGPRPVSWSDARLAAALTHVASLGGPVGPGDVAGILVRDCPYITDPVAMVQRQGGTEAEADAVMSVLAQSGRC